MVPLSAWLLTLPYYLRPGGFDASEDSPPGNLRGHRVQQAIRVQKGRPEASSEGPSKTTESADGFKTLGPDSTKKPSSSIFRHGIAVFLLCCF